ncbi:hypothetical protein Q5P01_000380 [Channa striata]|uniref:Ig-like domain-containing protein n=1 Tax=Channa striata TaxID=64152 RepID=A0AA88IVM5_CHASR|nr:hypothetical protein Q5P01_000380 [Channa striata]
MARSIFGLVPLFFSCLWLLSPGSVLEVKRGENVLLPCQAPRDASIVLLQWIRPDLKSDGDVFFYRDGRTYGNYQHPLFHGRVELRDPQMKDGDVSVVLKNVNVKDTGSYECLVGNKDSKPQLISSVQLQVKDFGDLKNSVSGGGAGHTEDGGDKDGGDKDSGHVGLAVGLSVVGVILVAVGGFLIFRKSQFQERNSY